MLKERDSQIHQVNVKVKGVIMCQFYDHNFSPLPPIMHKSKHFISVCTLKA